MSNKYPRSKEELGKLRQNIIRPQVPPAVKEGWVAANKAWGKSVSGIQEKQSPRSFQKPAMTRPPVDTGKMYGTAPFRMLADNGTAKDRPFPNTGEAYLGSSTGIPARAYKQPTPPQNMSRQVSGQKNMLLQEPVSQATQPSVKASSQAQQKKQPIRPNTMGKGTVGGYSFQGKAGDFMKFAAPPAKSGSHTTGRAHRVLRRIPQPGRGHGDSLEARYKRLLKLMPSTVVSMRGLKGMSKAGAASIMASRNARASRQEANLQANLLGALLREDGANRRSVAGNRAGLYRQALSNQGGLDQQAIRTHGDFAKQMMSNQGNADTTAMRVQGNLQNTFLQGQQRMAEQLARQGYDGYASGLFSGDQAEGFFPNDENGFPTNPLSGQPLRQQPQDGDYKYFEPVVRKDLEGNVLEVLVPGGVYSQKTGQPMYWQQQPQE